MSVRELFPPIAPHTHSLTSFAKALSTTPPPESPAAMWRPSSDHRSLLRARVEACSWYSGTSVVELRFHTERFPVASAVANIAGCFGDLQHVTTGVCVCKKEARCTTNVHGAYHRASNK